MIDHPVGHVSGTVWMPATQAGGLELLRPLLYRPAMSNAEGGSVKARKVSVGYQPAFRLVMAIVLAAKRLQSGRRSA